MSKKEENLKVDVEGYELITDALMKLVNNFPGLEEGEEFSFAQLNEDEGIAIFPSTGAFIYDERESITGHVNQTCQYPFTAVYRASGLNEERKIGAKEWLDLFARWIEKQPITINGWTFKLDEWPELSGCRKIEAITRQTPSYLLDVPDNKGENWICELIIRYRCEFYR